jgi:uncharacterized membrane protein
MHRLRATRYLLGSAIVAGLFGGLLTSGVALAAQARIDNQTTPPVAQEEPPPTPPTQETLSVYANYPIVRNTVGSPLKFEVILFYSGGSQPKTFDLALTAPEGWSGQFTGGYPETVISAFTVEPEKKSEMITLTITPPTTPAPQPGEYKFTVNAAAENVSGSAELTAIVEAAPSTYMLYLSTSSLRKEFSIKANTDNHIALELDSYSTGVVNNIVFSAEAPEGWEVSFTPANLGSMAAGAIQEIDFVIKPPAGAAAGDYPVHVKAAGDETDSTYDLRLTVASTSLAGAAGIGIAAGVIAGLIIWFRRAGTGGR